MDLDHDCAVEREREREITSTEICYVQLYLVVLSGLGVRQHEYGVVVTLYFVHFSLSLTRSINEFANVIDIQ